MDRLFLGKTWNYTRHLVEGEFSLESPQILTEVVGYSDMSFGSMHAYGEPCRKPLRVINPEVDLDTVV